KSLSRRVTTLVQHRSPPIKEYVQSTALDNCLVPASTAEQYVDLEIGQSLIDQWIKEGYPQLHIGAIRIVLTLHGRKGLPITTRITLLNTIYKEHTGDTVFIKAEREDEVPTIIQIPKQLPREKLTEIMPLKWITNYEKAFQNTTHVVSSDTKFTKLSDGSMQTTYEPISTSTNEVSTSAPTPSAPLIFQVLMIRPVTSEKEIPIHCFEADGTPVYTDKINGHFIWDVDPKMCEADCECRVCSNAIRSFCKPGRSYRKPDDPNKTSYESYSSWETYSPTSTDQSYHTDPDAMEDFSHIFMASRTDPQPSTQIVNTSDTSEETSEEPTPIVEEPLDHMPPCPHALFPLKDP
ncbi:hypothetical protein Ddye_023873, partial [Dipteronia dyeriana]